MSYCCFCGEPGGLVTFRLRCPPGKGVPILLHEGCEDWYMAQFNSDRYTLEKEVIRADAQPYDYSRDPQANPRRAGAATKSRRNL